MQPNFTSQRPKQTQTGANGSNAGPRRASSRERERATKRARELAGCIAANDERLCFAREGREGRGGQEAEGDIYSQKDILKI
jgi:hypothetical protein